MIKKIAKIVSLIFDPAVLGILILLCAIYKSNMPPSETISWIIGILILNGLIPFIFYIYFTKKGYIFDDKLTNRQVSRQRVVIYLVFLGLVGLEMMILAMTKQYQPLMAVFAGGLITISVALAVTYFWKISVHATMITYFSAMIWYIYGQDFWPIIFLIPMVCWSRLVLKRHTFWQLVGGSILALSVVIGIYYLYK